MKPPEGLPFPPRVLDDPELRYLDGLQEPMEAIILGQKPNEGRFCGHCYAHLAEPRPSKRGRLPAGECTACGRSTEAIAPVKKVPNDVLALYLAKRKREGLIVNAFAFFGLFLSLVLSAVLWFTLPGGWWLVLPFAMLAFGSYYLARLLGLGLGASIGYYSGCGLRDRRWKAYLRDRR